MNEQPIGFVILDKLLKGDELEQVKQEAQAMMDAYDGSAPFPEWAEQYMQFHPSQWDFRALAQFLMPPNDPRNKPAQKHDGRLNGDGSHNVYPNNFGGIAIHANDGITWMEAKEALSLLAWLKQEESALQQLAEQGEV